MCLHFFKAPKQKVQHTQTIRRQQPTNCFRVSDHFAGLALKELNVGIRMCIVTL